MTVTTDNGVTLLRSAAVTKRKYKAGSIEDLEAKLAKAVEALKFHNAAIELCSGEVTHGMIEAYHHTKRTLAELTGETI